MPPPRAEAIPPAPRPAPVWVPGYRHWNGTKYVLVNGHYRYPEGRTLRWVPGRWVASTGGWVWIAGSWR